MNYRYRKKSRFNRYARKIKFGQYRRGTFIIFNDEKNTYCELKKKNLCSVSAQANDQHQYFKYVDA